MCLLLMILNITSQEHLVFTSLHIGSRLFELFSKEVRVKKQPGMSLNWNFIVNEVQSATYFSHTLVPHEIYSHG